MKSILLLTCGCALLGENVVRSDEVSTEELNRRVPTTAESTNAEESEAETCRAVPSADGCDDASEELSFGQRLVAKSLANLDRFPQLMREVSLDGAQSIEMHNPNSVALNMYWVAHNGAAEFKGRMPAVSVRSTNSFVGHMFQMADMDSNETVFEFTVESDKNMYVVPCLQRHECDDQFVAKLREKEQFLADYLRTNKRPWIVHWPRSEPVVNLWRSVAVAHIRHLQAEGQWHCHKPAAASEAQWQRTREQMAAQSVADNLKDAALCDWRQSAAPLKLQLETVALSPKIFVIENVLSADECELIKSLAKPLMRRSLAGNDGGLKSNTRTSQTTWLTASKHVVVAALYQRAAALLGLTNAQMDASAEHLQVVHYSTAQEYKAHYDFGNTGVAKLRAITLLFYLNAQRSKDAGGETAFPKAVVGNRTGLSFHPGKGNAALFYDVLDDGNGDHRSLHAGAPVLKGHKWICNFWIWDPIR